MSHASAPPTPGSKFSGEIVYDRFRPDDVAAYETLKRQAFARDVEIARYLRGSVGETNIRVMRAGSELAAILAMLPMAQVYGGRTVRSMGIANVAVAPTWRGRGVSSTLMHRMLEEARDSGYVLSTLYASSLPVYRRVGYEPAGIRSRYTANPAEFATIERPARLSPATRADVDALAVLHDRQAATTNGNVARSPTLWQRKLDPHKAIIDGYFVHSAEGGPPTGYILAHHNDLRRMDVVDWCALDREAALQVLSFMAASRAVVRTVTWDGGPEDMLLHLAPTQGVAVEYFRHWTTRIVDVAGALTARGYPAGITAEFVLDVSDALLPWNNGAFHVAVRDGTATVTSVPSASAPRLRLDVAALAPLFTGHLAPAALLAMGMITGDGEAVDRAAAVFAGPKPWMTDVF